ncbi:uncharacterized protein LOC143239768 [Tachypleus tridentatus]|uniref:uncharacterized protein LOC143239768 n=1 Tax=Tachypleus tridentatus TaxID=6853 RepID=UPI003FD66942
MPTESHDVIARVFKFKINELMRMITTKDCGVLKKTRYNLYSTEWLKRGLPHAHILVWLREKIHGNSPVCQPFQKSVYGVSNQESIDVECHLEADPRDIKFFWRFNSSSKVEDTILHKIHSEFQSIASYRIQTSEDYGTLMCWGENSIGVQREPCVFKIIPAEAPEPVQNCTVFNRTEELILVECLEGFNGGLDQTFIMEIYTKESESLYAKVSSHVPMFLVNGLTPGTFFILLVYAVNRCGRSSAVRISTSTVRQAEKLTGNRGGVYVFNPVLTIFISATVALILFIVMLVIIIKVKKKSTLKVLFSIV